MGIVDRLRSLVTREPEVDRAELMAHIAAASGQPLPIMEKALAGYKPGPRALLRELLSGRARIDRRARVWLKDSRRQSVPATVKKVERRIWGKDS